MYPQHCDLKGEVESCDGSMSSCVTGEPGGGILPGAFVPREFPSLNGPEGPLLCLCPNVGCIFGEWYLGHLGSFLLSLAKSLVEAASQKGPKDILASWKLFFFFFFWLWNAVSQGGSCIQTLRESQLMHLPFFSIWCPKGSSHGSISWHVGLPKPSLIYALITVVQTIGCCVPGILWLVSLLSLRQCLENEDYNLNLATLFRKRQSYSQMLSGHSNQA